MEKEYIVIPNGGFVSLDELSHAGIKGMKWGVRRYQNKDGSLTAAGKKRYYKEADAAGYKETNDATGIRYKTGKKGKVENFDADTKKWVIDDLGAGKKVADEATNLTGKLKKLNDDSMRNRKIEPMDLSKMSDKEMRDQINRAMLERQYNDMFNPAKESKGRESVSRVLETTGDVLAVGASAVALAVGILELKKKLG